MLERNYRSLGYKPAIASTFAFWQGSGISGSSIGAAYGVSGLKHLSLFRGWCLPWVALAEVAASGGNGRGRRRRTFE